VSLLEELVSLINEQKIPVETGVFSKEAPETYIVLTPLADLFELNADDCPGADVQEVRISLYSKRNPRAQRNRITRALIAAGITITNRSYIEYETDTMYHHYELDTAKQYIWYNNETE
jgi:hypothetical protein